MKEVAVGDAGKVLLVRDAQGAFSACAAKCPHYGASLATGVRSLGLATSSPCSIKFITN